MIEGVQIDWGGYNNNLEYIIIEMLDFDVIIGNILKFVEEDGEILVIVIVDYEMGGYLINLGFIMDKIIVGFIFDYYMVILILVFVYGLGVELFGGIYENIVIYDKMKEVFGFQSMFKFWFLSREGLIFI